MSFLFFIKEVKWWAEQAYTCFPFPALGVSTYSLLSYSWDIWPVA